MLLSPTLLSLFVMASGIGQEPQADSGANIIGTAVGLDGATIAWSLLYARGVPLAVGRQLVLSTIFTVPMTQPDLRDWRWATGLRIDMIRRGGFAIPVAASFVLRRLDTIALDAIGLGSELAVMPGYYGRRWFAAGELSWDQEWATHTRHSDIYRRVVYQDVKDGWYGLTGLTMRYGARIGGRPWRRLELWVRAGYEQHGRFNTIAPPIYGLIGANVRF